jgi:hypothetical protein
MSTTCIYCTKPTAGDATRAHVFPEALGNRNLLLPAGTVCRKCNQYAGHELESALIAHPSIAMALHFWGIHGKKRRIRKQLGTVLVEPSEPGIVSMKFSIAEPKVTFHADGAVEMQAHATTPRGFRHERFRRALHYVGMNVVAKVDGAESLLDSKYDPVRTYIRRPKNRQEAWLYTEDNPAVKNIPLVLDASVAQTPNGKIVIMQLFQTAYAVDLLNSGDLKTALSDSEVRVVDVEERDLPPVVIRMKGQAQAPPAA